MSTVVLSETDSGGTIELERGQTFLVRLPENPTTGYRWEIEDLTEEIVVQQGQKFEAASGMGVGGSGMRTFQFEVVHAGTTQIRLRHWQRFEGEPSIDRRFNVTVRVPN